LGKPQKCGSRILFKHQTGNEKLKARGWKKLILMNIFILQAKQDWKMIK
jgi:hypothetical protein